MKKIAILTWLHNGNYGSILQGYALQRYLRNEGYEVNNIDLHPSIVEKLKNCFKQGNPFISLIKEKKVSVDARKACADSKAIERRIDKFDSFLRNEFCLTHSYRKFGDLKEIIGKYDAYICGSDQIWSPMLLSPSYYFDFLPDSAKKISYACSFGMSFVPNEKKKRIANWLNRYDAISVREEAGLNIVKELTDKDATINVDPTMLLCADEWNRIVTGERLEKNSYMLCYFLSYNEEQWKKSAEIAKEKGLKMIVIPVTKESYQKGDTVICDVGPTDWINLIKHADMVATDSFHGCVFSIIYQRQFVVFKRFSDSHKLSQNSRIYTLLSAYELKKCIAEDISKYRPSIISENDYAKVTETLSANVNESKNWLKKAIEA